jgi:hypothetical protein
LQALGQEKNSTQTFSGLSRHSFHIWYLFSLEQLVLCKQKAADAIIEYFEKYEDK